MDALLNTVIEVSQKHLDSLPFPEQTVLSSLNQPNKSNAESVVCRKLGNKKYESKIPNDDLEALEWFTKSVAWATEGSKELALAYGNRSTVLLKLHMYAFCLLDVNRALKCDDCPENSKEQLRARKLKCLNVLRSRRSPINDDQTEPVDEPKTNDYLLEMNDENPFLPNTSPKVKLAYSRNWGRHMVAAKDIEPGEILSIEEFFAASLNQSQCYTHCSYCFVKCEALIGCVSCSKMMYCSSKCRTQAHNAYHRVECKMWSFYEDEGLDAFDIAAIRALLIGTEQGDQLNSLANKMETISNDKNVLVDKRFKNDYISLLKLQSPLCDPPKLIVLSAVKIITVLHHLSFFGNPNENSDLVNKSKQFATIALIRHLTSVNSFGFPISDLSPGKMKVLDEVHVIGIGMCALHNLVNHSCDPNIADVVGKRNHIYFSLRPIKRDEQIFFSYGVCFAKNSLKQRKEKLSLYGFTCGCRACKSEWPKYRFLKKMNPEFMMQKKNQRVLESLTLMKQSMMKNAQQFDKFTTEMFKTVVSNCKMVHQNVKAPCDVIVMCEELIARFLKRSFGNYYSKYTKWQLVMEGCRDTKENVESRDDDIYSEESNSFTDPLFECVFNCSRQY